MSSAGCRTGHLLARAYGVAASDGDRKHPHWHHGREVERGDTGGDTQRLSHGIAVHAQEFVRDWRSDIAVSTAIGQFEAVRAGAGIGICHDFMASGVPGLTRLFPDMSVTRSYWIVWHENLRVARRVQAVVQLLDEMVRNEREHFMQS